MSPNAKAINVVALSKSFGNKKILDNLNFSIPMNAVAGFLGPNGAGKTTLLRMLAGIMTPTEGDIEIDNKHYPKDAGKIASPKAAAEKPIKNRVIIQIFS